MKNKLCALFVVSFFMPISRAAASGTEGHGGDGFMHLFEKARLHTVSLLKSAEAEKFHDSTDPKIVGWVLIYANQLAKDVQDSKHVWSKQTKQNECAQTKLTSKSDIVFSRERCRESVRTLLSAIEVLAHESTHHLGIKDEGFATAVGVAVGSLAKKLKNEGAGVWVAKKVKEIPCKVSSSISFSTAVSGATVFAGDSWGCHAYRDRRERWHKTKPVGKIGKDYYENIHSIVALDSERMVAFSERYWATSPNPMKAHLYYTKTDSWEEIKLPSCLESAHHMVITRLFEGQLFVEAPCQEGARRTSFLFSPGLKNWKEVSFSLGSSSYWKGKYHRLRLGAIQTLDPLTKKWKETIKVPGGVGIHVLSFSRDYIFGAGYRDFAVYNAKFDKWDWDMLPNLYKSPGAIKIHSAGSNFVVMGEAIYGGPLGLIYNPKTQTWKKMARLDGPDYFDGLALRSHWVEGRLIGMRGDYYGEFFPTQ